MQIVVDAAFTPGPVAFATRPAVLVSCPCCWTDQRANRNRCWRCEAQFVFLDEQEENRQDAGERPQAAGE